MTREVMQQALDALELHGKQYPHMVKGYCLDARTALREALAQPVQPDPETAYWAEEYECCMMVLDSLDIARVDETGETYSLWGRITAYSKGHQVQQASEDLLKKYAALIYAVGKKFPNETRHETVLRYIRNAEASDGLPQQETK